MLRARTAASHNAKMTAKIANTGPLREIQSATQLEVAGDVAAIVVMTISLQTEHHKAGKSPRPLSFLVGRTVSFSAARVKADCAAAVASRSRRLRPSSQPSRLRSHVLTSQSAAGSLLAG